MVASAGSGALLACFLGLGPLYARSLGFSASGAASWMGTGILGGLILQVPVGRLSDRVGRRAVLCGVCLALVGTCAAFGGIHLEDIKNDFYDRADYDLISNQQKLPKDIAVEAALTADGVETLPLGFAFGNIGQPNAEPATVGAAAFDQVGHNRPGQIDWNRKANANRSTRRA